MSWALGRCCLVGQGALPLLSLKATEGPCGLCLQGSSREAGVIWVLHQEAAVAESVASCHSGICEKVKRPSGSSCSACFLESTSSRMCEHGQAAWRVLGGPGSEHGKPFSQPTRVCSVDYGILPYFHFSLSLLSCNCARFVLVSLSRPFCISSFLFIVASFHFFLILFFGSPLFIPPYLWKKKSIACVSFFFIFPFSFPFSQPSSFSQHWNSGGSHAEELERPGARPRLKARPQPPLFYPFTCSEPQFTDCVALSEHSIPGGQIALQMSVLMKN